MRGGFTLMELLVAALIFGFAVLGFATIFKNQEDLAARADRRQRALLVAQDLYEELRAAPFSSSVSPTPGEDDLKNDRTGRSLPEYDGFIDSPVTDILGESVPWGADLCRKVTIRAHTLRGMPQATRIAVPSWFCAIEVGDRSTNDVLYAASFIRTAHGISP